MTGGSIDTNFPHQLLLTKRHVLKLCKAFEKNSPVNMKLSKAHLSKTVQSGGFLNRFLGPTLKARIPLPKCPVKKLANRAFAPFRLTVISSILFIKKDARKTIEIKLKEQ